MQSAVIVQLLLSAVQAEMTLTTERTRGVSRLGGGSSLVFEVSLVVLESGRLYVELARKSVDDPVLIHYLTLFYGKALSRCPAS